MEPYSADMLPPGIRARFVEDVNGLRMHVLEAGFDGAERPCLLLLHGFPELAFSWRKVMPALAAAGYHVVAPDQRGYGRTTGWEDGYDADLVPYRFLNLVRDSVALVNALGYRQTAGVVGHDFGATVAVYCALSRPDMFPTMTLMSAPFTGAPAFPFDTAAGQAEAAAEPDIRAALAALARPRKHYQWYYSTRPANADMQHAPQGVHDVLRAYYHHKSADWPGNEPFQLTGWTASELEKMPTYYIMDHARNMAETVAQEMPSSDQIASCRWLPEDELRVYSGEFGRTGFQGGLNWYRCRTTPEHSAELKLFSGRTIDIPSCFIAGAQDWGIRQSPGGLEKMQESACTEMRACHLVEGAGHWIQQEQPDAVVKHLLAFLSGGG